MLTKLEVDCAPNLLLPPL